jgi:hypothetical protein
MDPRQLLGRLAQLRAEGESIVKQLTAAGVPQEEVMAALRGGGQQPMPQPGMGGSPPMAGPQGPMPMPGPQGPMPMNGGGGMPPGILGGR